MTDAIDPCLKLAYDLEARIVPVDTSLLMRLPEDAVVLPRWFVERIVKTLRESRHD